MLSFKNGEWEVCNYLVTFINREQEQEKYTDNPERYEALEQKHDEFRELKVEEVEWEDELLDRLDKINQHDISDGYRSILTRFLKYGEVTRLKDDGDDENDQELIEVSDDHPLAILKQYT